MGTDIHYLIERKSLRYDYAKGEYIDEGWREWIVNPQPRHRDYELFGFLAGVRREDLESHIAHRGIPCDLAEHSNWDEFERYTHSHTWATLKEFKDLPWGIPISNKGFVDREQYKVFKEKGRPEIWCGGILGRDIKIAESTEDFEQDESYTHVRVGWVHQGLKDSWFLNFVRYLSDCTYEGDENVRIILGFDS